MDQRGEPGFVQQLVAQPPVEAFDVEQANAIGPREPVTVLHGLARRDVMPIDFAVSAKARIAFEVNSVPLLRKIIPRIIF